MTTEINNNTLFDTTLGQACLSCHSDTDDPIARPRWQFLNSEHASSASLIDAVVSLNGKLLNASSCGPECHSHEKYLSTFDSRSTGSDLTGISCFTCHLPHTGSYGQWRMDTLRGVKDFVVVGGNNIVDMQNANMCANCHRAKNPPPDTSTLVALNASSFGPHNSAQAEIFRGAGGVFFRARTDDTLTTHYTATIASGGCNKCHFGSGQGDQFGEHTFNLQSDDQLTDFTANCNVSGCHGSGSGTLATSITDFEGPAIIATIDSLADSLKTVLVGRGFLQSNGREFRADSLLERRDAQLLYNYLLYSLDGSNGIHNPEYVRELLTQSLAQVDSLPPIARIVVDTSSGACVPSLVGFDASTSGGPITNYTWDFGGGDSSFVPATQRTYTTRGAKSVSLTVTGPGGSSTRTVPGGVRLDTVPIADFTLSDSVLTLTAGDSVDVRLTSQWGAIHPATRSWLITDSTGQTLKDTTSLSSINFDYYFKVTGLFTVRHTVTNPCGTDDTTRVGVIRVNPAARSPQRLSQLNK